MQLCFWGCRMLHKFSKWNSKAVKLTLNRYSLRFQLQGQCRAKNPRYGDSISVVAQAEKLCAIGTLICVKVTQNCVFIKLTEENGPQLGRHTECAHFPTLGTLCQCSLKNYTVCSNPIFWYRGSLSILDFRDIETITNIMWWYQ